MVAMSVLARDTTTNRIVHISDVPQGYKNAQCVECSAKLITSNLNPESRKVACYFRHEGTSGCSTMTALHLYAQQLIQELGQLCLPSFTHVVSEKDSTGARQSLELNKAGYLASLNAVSQETPYPDSGHRADVSAIEGGDRTVYIEIKVHHEVDAPKQQALHAARLDVIEIDLQALVDQQGLTKEEITEAVITSAPRHWVNQHRFNAEIDELRQKLQTEITQFNQKTAAERKTAREQRSHNKKLWRAAHSAALELIERYSNPQNRRTALKQLQRWCLEPGRPEQAVYESLIKRYGSIPNIVNIPVKGELAFKAHRIYWQMLIFRNVIQTMHDDTKRKIAQLKQRNRRHFYGEENAWLSELPGITPSHVYQVLIEKQLSLTTISQTFQDLAGEPLQENYSKRPEVLWHVTAKEYEALPKPVPAIRRYLNALTRSGILDPSGDTYFMQYQDRPDLLQSIKDYPALKEEGVKQYELPLV